MAAHHGDEDGSPDEEAPSKAAKDSAWLISWANVLVRLRDAGENGKPLSLDAEESKTLLRGVRSLTRSEPRSRS